VSIEVTPLKCGNCGAPLSTDPDVATVRCEHCQVDLLLPGAKRPSRSKKQLERARRGSRALFAGLAGSICLVIVGVLVRSARRGELLALVHTDLKTAVGVVVSTAFLYGVSSFLLTYLEPRLAGVADIVRDAASAVASVLVLVAMGSFAFRLLSVATSQSVRRNDIDTSGVYEQMEPR
jgi:DNA-directed RNA polymerase subunit RPC12/RpoP